MIESAISRAQGEYDADDIFESIASGHMQLWNLSDDTIAVTMRVDYPKFSRLRIVLFAGVMRDEYKDRLEELAKLLGCRGLEIFGRRGWVKRLERFGAREAYTVMTLDWEDFA